jgi:hypothetical protein
MLPITAGPNVPMKSGFRFGRISNALSNIKRPIETKPTCWYDIIQRCWMKHIGLFWTQCWIILPWVSACLKISSNIVQHCWTKLASFEHWGLNYWVFFSAESLVVTSVTEIASVVWFAMKNCVPSFQVFETWENVVLLLWLLHPIDVRASSAFERVRGMWGDDIEVVAVIEGKSLARLHIHTWSRNEVVVVLSIHFLHLCIWKENWFWIKVWTGWVLQRSYWWWLLTVLGCTVWSSRISWSWTL